MTNPARHGQLWTDYEEAYLGLLGLLQLQAQENKVRGVSFTDSRLAGLMGRTIDSLAPRLAKLSLRVYGESFTYTLPDSLNKAARWARWYSQTKKTWPALCTAVDLYGVKDLTAEQVAELSQYLPPIAGAHNASRHLDWLASALSRDLPSSIAHVAESRLGVQGTEVKSRRTVNNYSVQAQALTKFAAQTEYGNLILDWPADCTREMLPVDRLTEIYKLIVAELTQQPIPDHQLQPQPQPKETEMKLHFENITFINGNRASDYSDDQLLNLLVEANKEIKRLKDLPLDPAPDMVQGRIEALQQGVKALTAYMNGKPSK